MWLGQAEKKENFTKKLRPRNQSSICREVTELPIVNNELPIENNELPIENNKLPIENDK